MPLILRHSRVALLMGLLLTALSLTVTGCETAKGVGRDLQSVGDAIEKSVRNAQD